MALADQLAELAREMGRTPAQLALAWVLSRGPHVVPIPGTKRRRYLEENVAAAEISLTPAEMARITNAVPAERVAGDRYPADTLAMLDR